MDLNPFQRKLVDALEAAFGSGSLTITKEHGRSEGYVHGRLGLCEFWIYDAGADFVVGDRRQDEKNHWIFEPQDYADEEALINAFMADIGKVCGAPGAG